MRKTVFSFALLVALPVLALAQTRGAGGGAEQTLLDLERKWVATALTSDVATLDTILAANWTATSVDGAVVTRAQSLENAKKSKFTKSEASGMKVTMLSPTSAIVTGVWTGIGVDEKGKKVDTSERWTDVFVLDAGKWKCVASQSTTIKK